MRESIVRSMEGLHEKRTLELVKIAAYKGFQPMEILEWLEDGIEKVGDLYEKSEYFIADLIYAGIIFQGVLDLDEFKALYEKDNSQQRGHGKILTATVKGDFHNIGKKLFSSFAQAAGFDVLDIGENVDASTVVDKVESYKPDIIGLSGMHTSTLPEMRHVSDALIKANLRDRVKIIVGGSFINDGISPEAAGADLATKNITKAVRICEEWMMERA